LRRRRSRMAGGALLKIRVEAMSPISTDPFHGLPYRRYQIILADPPWKFKVYNEATGSSRAASNHYKVMDTAAISPLPAQDFAACDAALSLWVTAPFLQIAFDVMGAWGFPYSTNAVWTKDKFGTGFWFRSQHELVLVGKRGKFRAPAPAYRPSSVIQAPKREHSRKPDKLYAIIERAYPELPKIELFARNARPGWTAWGDEAPSIAPDKQIGIDPVRRGVLPCRPPANACRTDAPRNCLTSRRWDCGSPPVLAVIQMGAFANYSATITKQAPRSARLFVIVRSCFRLLC